MVFLITFDVFLSGYFVKGTNNNLKYREIAKTTSTYEKTKSFMKYCFKKAKKQIVKKNKCNSKETNVKEKNNSFFRNFCFYTEI